MRFSTFSYGWALMLFSIPSFSQKSADLFDVSRIHEIRVEITQPNYWETMWQEYLDFREFSGDDVPTQLVSVQIDGEEIDSVGIRFKGKSSWYYANDKKKPFRLDFNEYVSGQSYGSLKKLNLHNGMGDPSMMRELIGYKILREAGVKAPRVSFTKLYLNDEYWGIYTIVEAIDKPFLDRNFSSGDGNLWKNQRWSELKWLGNSISDYNEIFQLKTNKEENDWTKFIELMDVINNSSDGDFPQAIQDVFDVEQYLRVLAIDIMLNNWDSYIDNQRNFYLYFEPRSQKFRWIPWDYNLCLGGDLTLEGNPYRSYNQDCPLNLDFTYSVNARQVTLRPVSEPIADTYHWDFGDGNFSLLQNPIHEYIEANIYEVCLTATREENGKTCEQVRCKKIDFTVSPADCNSILDGSCPYPINDPVFQLVIADDDYCCSDSWDVFCELKYIDFEDLYQPNFDFDIEYNYDYPLDFENPDKVLIHRLLSVPEFKDRYLEHACLIRDKIFNADYLYPLIENTSELIRSSIYEEPNFLYSKDYFEYNIGNGTGGGGNATIPSLKHVLGNRFVQIDEDLAELNAECSRLGSSVGFGDIVINEFVASNSEDGGIADPDDGYADWIEIYNNTAQAVDLFNFYLSDDNSDLKKWQFPQGTMLAPDNYLIVWADNDADQTGIHAGFKLSKSGEFLSLMHEDGTITDSLTFGKQETNIAFARNPNGIGKFVKQIPTHGYNNENISSLTDNSFDTGSFIQVYPNPAFDEINILVRTKYPLEEMDIKLENVAGESMFFSRGRGDYRIDVSNFTSGIYFLKIKTSERQYVEKVVVSK